MSGYQRFVSYLYEYRNNQKSKNCGFSRVEVRDHQCKLEIHMKLPPCPFTPAFHVYTFVPSDGQLLGIFLGKAGYHQGTIYAMFTIPDKNIGENSYNMEDLGGILIQSDDGQIYATAWKEISIQPDCFVFPDTGDQVHAASLEENSEEDSDSENFGKDAVRRYPLETPPEIPAKNISEDRNYEFPADSPENTASQKFWLKIQESYPHTQPFFDDEIHECVRLSLKDIPTLAQQSLYIGSNQFLTHGCQTFHHFLLGKMENARPGEYVLAVPGVYDEKERFLASMFGFPNFKSARDKTIRPGQFGYWYRVIY